MQPTVDVAVAAARRRLGVDVGRSRGVVGNWQVGAISSGIPFLSVLNTFYNWKEEGLLTLM